MNTAANYADHAQLLSEQNSAMTFLMGTCQQLINRIITPDAHAIDARVAHYHRHDANVDFDNLAILDELASLDS